MPIDINYLQIQKKLQENGLMYQQTLKPTQLLVHPLNRGGAMLSHHGCHQKGAKIAANETTAHASEGTLCPPSGQERFLSLGSSHLSQFCKAVLHGCTTSNEELTAISHNGNLNLQACCGSQGNQNCAQKAGHGTSLCPKWKKPSQICHSWSKQLGIPPMGLPRNKQR